MKNKFNNFTLLQVIIGISLANLNLSGDDWPCYRGPNHDGISKESGWVSTWSEGGPKTLWKANVGTGFCTISVSKGRVYTMGNQNDTDTVYCLDENTGEIKWKYSYPCRLAPDNFEGGPTATPTVDENKVYTFSRFAHAHCLDAETGKVIWSKDLMKELAIARPQWGFSGSVLITGNLAIYNAGDAGVALDKNTGKVVWSTGKGASGYSTPVPFTMGTINAAAIFGAKTVTAVNTADGKKVWEFEWKTSYDVNAADPIIFGNRVFVSSGYNRGCGLFDFQNAQIKKLWENKNMRNHFATCVYYNGYIYGFDGNAGGGDLRCLDAATGELKWNQSGLKTGGLMIADGKIVALSDGGKLVIAEATPTGYKQLATAQPLTGKCWTMPVLANGKIFCRNARGDLAVLDVRKQK
jgi:outer membrane protein assembly factor BamB